MKKKDISIPYIKFESIQDIEEIVLFCSGEKWRYISEGELLTIKTRYESIDVWLRGCIVLLHNKPVFLNKEQFNAL
jgi:hypothetical protein